jgi:hypothetical protein
MHTLRGCRGPKYRACGRRIAHERLRSNNSCHLQCCLFWCIRGVPAARHYPRGTAGGAGGGLRSILSGSVLLLELVFRRFLTASPDLFANSEDNASAGPLLSNKDVLRRPAVQPT